MSRTLAKIANKSAAMKLMFNQINTIQRMKLKKVKNKNFWFQLVL